MITQYFENYLTNTSSNIFQCCMECGLNEGGFQYFLIMTIIQLGL